MIPNEDINSIRSKTNIVDIVSSYINLELRGKNFFAVCPFHDDHNPSMSVSEEKQIYTCFVCGASGNVYTFVQDYENVSFPEAVKIVANKIGYNLNYNVKVNRVNKESYEIMELANKYYINNLNSKEGIAAKKYLHDRALNDEILKEFNIGVALNDNNLSKLLLNKSYTESELIDLGLANTGENLYDVFRNRIIFPITNDKGEVVAFSGRIYNNENINKYVNSKETKIFKKGNILFNYDKAKNEVNKTKEVIIVEGFMDVIRMHTANVKNVVATMGTAITKEHINLLKKLNAKIILMMDNDDAGESSTILAGEEFLKANISPFVVRLSGEKDPDDYILKYGAEAFKEVIKNYTSFFDFKLSFLKKDADLNKSKELANYINSVIEELNKTDDELLREITINKLNKDYGIDKELIYSKLVKKEKIVRPQVQVKPKRRLNKYKKVCEAILYIMMKDLKYIKKFERDLGYIPDKEYGQIANDILAYYKIHNDFTLADFISFEIKSKYYESVLRIIADNEKEEPIYDEFDNYIEMIHKWIKDKQIDELLDNLKRETDINRKQEINDLIIKLKRESE